MAQFHISSAGDLPGDNVQAAVHDGLTGAFLATIPNTDLIQLGSDPVYFVNLYATSVSAMLGLPDDGSADEKPLFIIWFDEGSDDPPLAPARKYTYELVSGIQGWLQRDRALKDQTPIYATTSIPARGITPAVIAAGNPSYVRVDYVLPGGDPNSPVVVKTEYEVFAYDTSGRVSRQYTSRTVPSP